MPEKGIAHRIGPHVHRWQPRTLRGRLVLVSVLFGLIGALATFGAVHVTANVRYAALGRQVTAERLGAFRTFAGIEEADVGRYAVSIAASWERRSAEVSGVAPARDWIEMRMREGECSALLATGRRGDALTAVGSSAAIASLSSFIEDAPATGRSGLMWIDGESMIVASRPIPANGGVTLGTVAIARPLYGAAQKRFLPLTEHLTLQITPPSATPARAGGSSVAGFSNVKLEQVGYGARVAAELPGVDGGGAGIARIDIRDELWSASVAAGVRAALVSSVILALLGAGLGLALSSAMRRPLERTRRHLREEAPHALEGIPCKPLQLRPETTDDFRELGAEVDSLLDALCRRQAELVAATNEARTAQESLRAVLDGSPEGKILFDGDLAVYANRAASDFIGIPLDELVGMRTPVIAERMQAYGEDGRRLRVEDLRAVAKQPITARMVYDDRPERWLYVEVLPHASGSARQLVAARDITEDRRLDALREEVFALVSHDLRAPLTVVQGYLDILDRPLQPEARERALASARYNATKMADLLADLLEATSAEKLLAPKDLAPVDLAALAREVATSMAAGTRTHDIVVDAPESVVVTGEEGRLRQALLNLVANAVKYSPPGTAVMLRAGTRDTRAILAVEDEGPGIPSEARDLVFDRYGRVAATCAGKPGFGLGLYIVKLIVANHGGEVRAEAAPSGGARFVIDLPLAGTERAGAQ